MSCLCCDHCSHHLLHSPAALSRPADINWATSHHHTHSQACSQYQPYLGTASNLNFSTLENNSKCRQFSDLSSRHCEAATARWPVRTSRRGWSSTTAVVGPVTATGSRKRNSVWRRRETGETVLSRLTSTVTCLTFCWTVSQV